MKHEAIEILRKARSILHERGWYQGGMEKLGMSRGPCCLLHAIQEAAGMSVHYFVEEPKTPLDVAYLTLISVTGAQRDRLSTWNDKSERTLLEVHEAITGAIEKLI